MNSLRHKPRIFMIGYSPNKGGVEAYIRNLCGEISDDFVIILHWPEMIIDGRKWIIPKNRHNILKYRQFWKKFFSENKFDVIYFNTCDIVSIDMLRFAKAANIPVRIIHSHSTDMQVQRKGLLGLLHKWQEQSSRSNLHKYATDLLACSKSAGDWMFDGREYTIIKNGIAVSRYAYSPEKALKASAVLSSKSHPVVACIGRLDKEKNPFFSIEVFKEICRLSESAQCLFIGDGQHRAELEKLTRDAGLDERIIFTGGVDNVSEWLSYIDCILMPSLFEGLPFALVEAQAAGQHSLVSDTVSEESNITGLVKYKSLNDPPLDWAKQALELAALPREDKAAELAKAGFSIEHTADTVRSIINKTLHA